MQSHTNGWTVDFALNYNKAIKFLAKPLFHKGQQAIDVCLISSIIFAYFEVRRSQTQVLFLLTFTLDNAKQLRFRDYTRSKRHEDTVRGSLQWKKPGAITIMSLEHPKYYMFWWNVHAPRSSSNPGQTSKSPSLIWSNYRPDGWWGKMWILRINEEICTETGNPC